MPRQALWLMGIALSALAAAAGYTLWLNPEIRVYHHAVRVKRAWCRQLATNPIPRFILAGGSSAAFSVDGEWLRDQHGLSLVNFGLHAGMGAPFLTAVAAKEAQAGDTLILGIEPGLFTNPFSSPVLGAQIGMALGEPQLIHASHLTGERVHWMGDLLSLRPGAPHALTLMGAIAIRKRLYRYSFNDFHPSGWQEAKDFREFTPALAPEDTLSDDAARLLDALARWGQTNHVQLMYSLPWGYVPAGNAEAHRRANLAYLIRVSRKMPVLQDSSLGVHSVREHFADTAFHLTPAAARLRTENVAAALRTRATWTTADLEALARAPIPAP